MDLSHFDIVAESVAGQRRADDQTHNALEVLADPEAMQMLQDSLADIRHGRVFDQDDVERELL